MATVPAPEWVRVDDYTALMFLPEDPILAASLRASADAGLPSIQVAPNQGKLLYLLVKAMGARRVLEVGTLGGYSAIWLGRALSPGGTLLTLEVESRHAEVARANLKRAGLDGRVQVLLGPARETLAKLVERREEPFDFVFIDADKPGYPEYLEWAVRLSRPGALIAVDNVVRGGAVADGASDDPSVRAVRAMNDVIAQDPRLSATTVQTVGVKGYDGFTLVLVGASGSSDPDGFSAREARTGERPSGGSSSG